MHDAAMRGPAAHRQGREVRTDRHLGKGTVRREAPVGAVAPADLAHYLKVWGLGDTHALNRLSIAAAESALKDQDNIRLVNKRVAEEREKWNAFLDKSGLQHTASGANFVFFDTKKPYDDVRKKLEEAGILIGRKFEPYSTWIRISIGLPEENAIVRSIIGQVVSH